VVVLGGNKNINMKPYKEEKQGNIIRRTFSHDVSENELVWHRDHEDRVVLPLNENDWMVQFDNELPTKLMVGEEYFIPKNVYHRVIKGSGDLMVEIIETNFDDGDAYEIYEIHEVIEEGKKKKKKDACYHKVRARYDVWPSAYACVPENTSKALTRNGWKSVDELNVGEEIMTYNIENDELEFKPILNLHRYKDVKTNIVKSGNNGFVFEATDNHKWVVKLPETKGKRLEKYNRINDKALIETTDLLANKNNKHLVVSAQYNGGEKVKLDKIFKYGTNWVKYILDVTNEQRQAWLFSAIVYDGNQQKVERLTENINNIEELDWVYTGTQGKQSFGFKQKDIEHRDAFLLSAFLNSGLVTWKKVKDKDIYSCHYSSNKRFKNTSNFKLVKENVSDVWCPETENGTWVMMQETDGNGVITITGNSGALVKCRKVGAANWGNKSNESEEPIEEKWSDDYKKSIDCKNPKGFSQKAHCDARKKRQRGEETKSKPLNESIGEINRFVKEYIKNTNFDIENSLGNCSFFTKDVVLWAKKNGYSYSQSQYVYMPMSEKYRKQNNISDSEWEDHIVPMINGYIIDFTYTPQGVSKKIRTSNTIPPAIFKFNESLFKPSGAYGKFGYTKPEINHVYGKRVGLSTFDTEEPKPKDTPNNPTKTAKRQFAKDLQKDPDYIKHIENSMGYGSVNATSKDPFISKTKYSRIGKDELDELTVYEAKKTDFSKEKSKGLHGWFERQGGKGKSKGWVDCNTCRKDPETGRKKCKTCGRKEGEERAKYPACRPTPSACGTRGKGKNWGKKSTNENFNMSDNISIFDKNYIKMKVNETFNQEEPLVLPSEPKTKPKESPMVQPSRRNKPFLPERESQPDPKAEK
jgi:hypothetical protein